MLLAALLFCSCADTRHHLVVSVKDQRLMVLDQGKMVAVFPVSTSKFGTGNTGQRYFTPLGRHQIAKKIGGGAPLVPHGRRHVFALVGRHAPHLGRIDALAAREAE